MDVNKFPRVGDTVQVPFGLGTVPGVVLEVYGPADRRRVLLELRFGGEDDERSTVSLRVDELSRSSAA